MIFEGEYKDGKRWNGIKREYFRDKLIFEGEYKNGLMLSGIRKRYGYDKIINQVINEFYRYDRRSSQTYEIFKEYKNGQLFRGKFIKKKQNNYNNRLDLNIFSFKRKNKDREHKDFSNKLLSEIKKEKNNFVFSSENFIFHRLNGKFIDKIIKRKSSDLNYYGEYKNGKRFGSGKEYDNNGNLIFNGIYSNGKREKGKEFEESKLIFSGEYKEGRMWTGKRI